MAGRIDFLVAEAGASAALAGLIFVAISISLDELIRFPHLLNRAAGALTMLVGVLVSSSLLLAPGQAEDAVGLELAALGLAAWGVMTAFVVREWHTIPAEYRTGNVIAVALRQVASITLCIAGVVLVARGDGGLYWLLPSFAAAFVGAIIDAWVILVEVHR